MHVETVSVGPFEVNAYLCRREGGGLLVVDPGGDAELLASGIDRLGGTVAAYLLTHGHADHIGALADLHRRYPAPVYLHPEDQAWAFTAANQIPPFYGPPVRPDAVFRDAVEGAVIEEADVPLQVLATPGHTPGGVCYLAPGEHLLFSGDTLFQGSVGRTDLPGGDTRVLAAALSRLAGLPDGLRVLPGHGPESNLGEEKRNNYFLRMN